MTRLGCMALVVLLVECATSCKQDPRPRIGGSASTSASGATALVEPDLSDQTATAARAPTSAQTSDARPGNWAQPVDRPGLPNLFRVSEQYYRGAQPTAEGIRQLPKLGVRTIVNLRSLHSDDDVIVDQPLQYEQIRFNSWHAESEDVVRFLKIVTTPSRQPIFVHCQYGADRTGMMTAIYRVAVQGWSKDDAIREMTQGGFGFHPEWQNLVDYVRAIDVEALQRQAGITPP